MDIARDDSMDRRLYFVYGQKEEYFEYTSTSYSDIPYRVRGLIVTMFLRGKEYGRILSMIPGAAAIELLERSK